MRVLKAWANKIRVKFLLAIELARRWVKRD
jgi:hypothetical protein